MVLNVILSILRIKSKHIFIYNLMLMIYGKITKTNPKYIFGLCLLQWIYTDHCIYSLYSVQGPAKVLTYVVF